MKQENCSASRSTASSPMDSFPFAVRLPWPFLRLHINSVTRHYLREAAKPIYEADRHAKKELKKQVRGVRPIERAIEGRSDAEAEVIHEYCLAVRASVTDDGLPPLSASGLRLQQRLQAISDSLERVEDGPTLCMALARG